MTFREAHRATNDWKRKCVIISLFHFARISKNKQWTLKDTAKYFNISSGLASENIKLAKQYELIKECSSRNEALKRIK